MKRAVRMGTIAPYDLPDGESRNLFVDKHLRAMLTKPIIPRYRLLGWRLNSLLAARQGCHTIERIGHNAGAPTSATCGRSPTMGKHHNSPGYVP